MGRANAAAKGPYRLRPRRIWASWLMLIFGALLGLVPFAYGVHGSARLVDLIASAGILATVVLFLASPTWRSYVLVMPDALVICGPRKETFRLPWTDVVEILVDQEERAALVRGPQGKNSFLLPSGAHPAPYQIAHGEELFEKLLTCIPAEKIRYAKVFQ